jgi:hypothetical protein
MASVSDKIDSVKNEAPVKYSAAGSDGKSDKLQTVFMESSVLGDFKWPNHLKYENTDDLSYETIGEKIADMLNGKYRNSGFWRDKTINIMIPRTEDDISILTVFNPFKKSGDRDELLKIFEQEKIVDMILDKLKSQIHLDRTVESIELLLLSARNSLAAMMNAKNTDFIYLDDFQDQFMRQSLPKLISAHLDHSKVFLAKHHVHSN